MDRVAHKGGDRRHDKQHMDFDDEMQMQFSKLHKGYT